MKRTLMLVGKNNDMFFCNIPNVTREDLYRKGYLTKFLKHIDFLAYFAIADWKIRINKYDTIIVIDSTVTYYVLKTLLKKTKGDCRVILYFRNKITPRELKYFKLCDKYDKLEMWSYNTSDCKKYNLKYNNQVLSRKYLVGIINNNSDKESCDNYDLVFIGENKGREDTIINILNLVNTQKTYFYMIGASKDWDNKCVNNRVLQYDEYIKIVDRSNAVLDIVNENNWGLTLRPLEAMFLGKKLITNYSDIKKYDFYDKNYIFILGEDDNTKLAQFIHEKNSGLYGNQDIIDKYDVEGWINNFYERK